jgi:beta-carotene 3-hydroxylase
MGWWGPLVMLGMFGIMECVAWLTHKYLMHGAMWHLHSDHHVAEHGFFQRNDLFFLIFAVPSWLCIMLGMMAGNYFPVWIGYGIALYGLAYFLVHDVYIHRRFRWLRDIDHPYFMAIRKAHKVHHKHLGKEQGECFGMLVVPRRYYTEAKILFRRKYGKT